jgi:hypothetical protein
MSRGLGLGSTLVHLACVMVVAWVTGFLCDKGMPRMIASGIVYIVAGELMQQQTAVKRLLNISELRSG